MFGMNVMAWNGGELEKLKVLQNRVGLLALGAPKWTAVEAVRGDLGWNFKVWLEQDKHDETPSYCKLCNCTMKSANKSALIKHQAPSHRGRVVCDPCSVSGLCFM
ncbi:hypothetical protein FHG87_016448 [Trinorchestia longiramus]|nr:hypothetical protein FHG87_016448 [Trinorchestia longiramus]